MRLLSFDVLNFRNITSCTLAPHPLFSFIRGDNGQGKTNLMEALHLIFTMRPIRTGNDLRPLVKKGEEYFSLRAQIAEDGGSSHGPSQRTRELFFSFAKNGQKKIMMDRSEVAARDFLSTGALHFFSPDQASLLVESPEVRRRALDRSVFHVERSYFDTLAQFKGVLKRRNTILKMERDAKLLASLDRTFAPLSFSVSESRRRFLEALSPHFTQVWSELKPRVAPMSISFAQNLGGAKSEEAFLQCLLGSAESDFQRGTSLLGPQREDIRFLIGERSSKHFVSHGERKVAALSFVLASIKLVRKISGKDPILIIDDLAAELDRETKDRVLAYLDGLDLQIVMTGISFPWDTEKEGGFFSICEGNLAENGSAGK